MSAPPRWSKWIFDAEDDHGRHYWRYMLNPPPGHAYLETKCNEDHNGSGSYFAAAGADLYSLCHERARSRWWWLFEDQPQQLPLF